MALGAYPVGKPNILNKSLDTPLHAGSDFDCETFLESLSIDSKFFDKILYKSKLAPHYILTIEYEVPNLKQSLIPHKEDGRLIYPVNGIYTGTYNDVDIREMLIDGIVIKKIINGIYWVSSERIFTNLITYMYDKRKELKSKGDYMEYVFKIMINSMYGKFNETILESSYFREKSNLKDKINERVNKLNNDQEEVDFKLSHPVVRKPTYIASYVTAYSRAIMNEYIRKVGIDNIFYTDTDSIYVLKSAFEKSGIVCSNDLGGVKNDYGENIYISEAYFLDQKRYFLQKTNTKSKISVDEYNKKVNEIYEMTDITKQKQALQELSKIGDPAPISAKYVGLTFKDVMNKCISNEIGEIVYTQEKKDYIKSIYTDILKNYNDYTIDNSDKSSKQMKTLNLILNKWKRVINGISINKAEIKFSIAPEKKGLYLPHEKCVAQYYGLGYDINKPSLELSKTLPKSIYETFKKTKLRVHTLISRKNELTVDTILPLTSPKIKAPSFTTELNMDKALNNGLKVNYYVYIAKNGIKSFIYRSETWIPLTEEEKEIFTNSKEKPYNTINDTSFYKIKGINSDVKKLSIGDTGRIVLSKMVPKYYNTCELGPSTHINLSEEDQKMLYPIIALPENMTMINSSSDGPENIICKKVREILKT